MSESCSATSCKCSSSEATLSCRSALFRVKNRCAFCGKTNTPRATGNTPGAPDLFVTRTDWPPNTWFAIELKAPGGGVVSSEQRHLADQQRILITDSLDEIWEVLEKHHQALNEGR